ncbi:hypothetical protein OAA39_00970, partial [bacterium]|nr:hypothetical protein [bacterium]
MAQKVNLKSLFQNGKLSVTVTGTEDGGNGVVSLFDGNTTNTFLKLDQDAPLEVIDLNFTPQIQGTKFQVVFTYQSTYNGSINVNNNTFDLLTFSDGSGDTSIKTIKKTFTENGLHQLKFNLGSSVGAADHQTYQIELFILDEADPYEFNDSVLSTKAWNSSRYDGRQLQASQINVARKSDIGNNDRTPIIQKYTRNIYIGNTVVGLGNTSAEDGNLVQYENFSYATTNLYITINNDDTITPNRLEDVGNKDTYKKIGFYQSFFDDFPIGSNTKIILGDPTVSDQLKPQYPIYFNGGQLQKLFCLTQGITNHGNAAAGFIYTSGSGTSAQPITDSKRVINLFTEGFDGNQGILGFGINFLNDNLVRNFYTGSIQISGQIGRPNSEITDDDMDAFFTRYFNYQTEALYKGDKRLFATMVSGSSNFQGTDPTFFPLITNVADNLTSSISLNELPIDLSYLSTAEVESHLVGTSDFSNGSLSHDTFKLILSDKNTL